MPLLTLASFCFSKVVAVRNFLYDGGWLKAHKSPLFVVSIGNVVAGGTGKTPFTIFLAEKLLQHLPDVRIAILTRGYKSKAEKSKKPVLVREGNHLRPPSEVGDEAFMMAAALPQVTVIAGRSRKASAQLAEEMKIQLVLLEDGMQHRQLFRDVEIALVDGQDPWGGGKFLPQGHLRDFPHRVEKADFILCTEGMKKSNVSPHITLAFKAREIVFDNTTRESNLKSRPVALFCAVAKPHKVLKSVEELQGKVIAQLFLKDHQKISKEQLQNFALQGQSQGAELLLCTEKDWVKLTEEEKKDLPLPLGWIKREIYIKDSLSHWDALINRIHLGIL